MNNQYSAQYHYNVFYLTNEAWDYGMYLCNDHQMTA